MSISKLYRFIAKQEIMGIPKTSEEYIERFEMYRLGMRERKGHFNANSIDGFRKARLMYYDAIIPIFFVCSNYFHLKDIGMPLPNVFPSHEEFPKNIGYIPEVHQKNIRSLIVNLRKIAECNMFLDRIYESIELCELIVEMCSVIHKTQIGEDDRVLFLTYCVLSQCYLVRKEFGKAEEYIKKGLKLVSSSSTLKDQKRAISRSRKLHMKGREYDFREKFVRGFMKDLHGDYNNFVDQEFQRLELECLRSSRKMKIIDVDNNDIEGLSSSYEDRLSKKVFSISKLRDYMYKNRSYDDLYAERFDYFIFQFCKNEEEKDDCVFRRGCIGLNFSNDVQKEVNTLRFRIRNYSNTEFSIPKILVFN